MVASLLQHSHRFVALFCAVLVSVSASASEPDFAAEMHEILGDGERNNATKSVKYHCPALYESLNNVAQGENGWFFRKTALQEDFEALNRTAYYLGKLRRAFQKQGSELILFLISPRAMLSANQLDVDQPMIDRYELDLARENFTGFIKNLNAQGGLAVSLPVDAPIDDFYHRTDFHWTPKGARLSAQYVADVIKEMSFYQRITPATYVTTKIGDDTIKRGMGQMIDRLCDEDIPAEPFALYRTTKELGDGADALFGDDGDNGMIVLLGTSYTDGKYNFDGFLSEYTGMEVANFAIRDGGLSNSFISYVTRPPKKRLDPDVIVWESLAHYDVNQAEYMFRQAIPAVHGECSEKDAVLSGEVEITGGEQTVLLDDAAAKHIAGEDYYLFFEASNPAFVKMTLEMNHADGDGEWFPVDRSWRYNNTGRFFFELSDELSAPLDSINILHDENARSTISYRLCRANNVDSNEGKTAKSP